MYEVFFSRNLQILGNHWSQDFLSFSKVSRGIGNFNTLLKQYDHLYHYHHDLYTNAPKVLLITPEKEKLIHLAAYLQAECFKNEVAITFFLISPNPKEIENILKVNDFSLIGISLADFTLINEVINLIAVIRNLVPVNCPLILGGEVKNWSETQLAFLA